MSQKITIQLDVTAPDTAKPNAVCEVVGTILKVGQADAEASLEEEGHLDSADLAAVLEFGRVLQIG